jgi:putative transposase
MPIDLGLQHRRRLVAIDPGVRSFLTTYDECGDSVQVDALQSILIPKEKIRFLQRQVEALKKNCKEMTKQDRDMTRLKILKLLKQKSYIELKTVNRVKDMHYKLASFLCRNYEVIFLPPFGTSEMVGSDSVLRKRTKDRMLTLSHYKFKQILTLKAKEFGSVLHIIGEEYTTKTCCCGLINDNVGAAKTFRCIDQSCGYTADRDLHGARNIFVKGVSELQVC